MICLDERGKQCPLPVIEAKRALEAAFAGEVVEVIVDNEIAVQNLQKMASHMRMDAVSEKTAEREYRVKITAVGGKETEKRDSAMACEIARQEEQGKDGIQRGVVAVLSSNCMGNGEEALGKILMKGFVYALAQLEKAPETILLYNSGVFLSCQGSDVLEDLKMLEEQGCEVLSCGTCLDYYELKQKLAVGTVTNMYEIVERQASASLILRP